MEKDKLRLSLKHLPLKRLDKMIIRLQELLEKIPTGEIMHRSLLKEQAELQDNYNNSTLSAGKWRDYKGDICTFIKLDS